MIIEIKKPFTIINTTNKPIEIGDLRLIRKGRRVLFCYAKDKQELLYDYVIKVTDRNRIAEDYLYGEIEYTIDSNQKILPALTKRIIMIRDIHTEPFNVLNL